MIVDALRHGGYAYTQGLGSKDVAETIAYLKARPCYPRHVRVYSEEPPLPFAEAQDRWDVWCHDYADAVLAPHFWELALKQAPVAESYLGTRSPRLYSLNAYWAKAGVEPPLATVQEWHRDTDDERFIALYCYGTDVLTEADGPHLYKENTQDPTVDDGPVRAMIGPAGTAFITDSRGVHMGLKPRQGLRLVLWARWGVSAKPHIFDWEGHCLPRAMLGSRFPSDARLQEMIQLIVA